MYNKDMRIKMNERRIFNRLKITYVLILVCAVCVMVTCFGLVFKNSSKKVDDNDLKRSHDEAYEFLSNCDMTSRRIRTSLYQNKQQVTDVVWFLSLDEEEYLIKHLSYYTQMDDVTFQGKDSFVREALARDTSIKGLILTSTIKEKSTWFGPDGSIKNVFFDEEERGIDTFTRTPDGDLCYTMILNDQETVKEIGYLEIIFSDEKLAEIDKRYSKVQTLVFGETGKVIYSTSGEYDQKIYELPKYHATDDIREKCTIVSYIEDNEYARIPFYGYAITVLSGLIVLSFGYIIVYKRVKRLSGRLDDILDAMDRAMNGDLNIELKTRHNKDELDVISENFTQMCHNLDSYIQKSYIAALEQKNAELKALQNQINPHFLYNTLEAIRMQAICNGDKETGNMLYNLAVLFRGQINGGAEIPLEKEMDFCKKYIELLQVRFANKFSYEINLPPELAHVPIIKISLQPIVENYFVHGIRLENNDNHLIISARREENDTLAISIEDNGVGMPEEKMQEPLKGSSSIGLANVMRRLEAAYGKGYGVTLEKREPHGLIVTLRIPYTD